MLGLGFFGDYRFSLINFYGLGFITASYSSSSLVFGQRNVVGGRPAAWWPEGSLLVLVPVASYALCLYFHREFVQRIGSLRMVGLMSIVASLFCIAHFLGIDPLASARVADTMLVIVGIALFGGVDRRSKLA